MNFTVFILLSTFYLITFISIELFFYHRALERKHEVKRHILSCAIFCAVRAAYSFGVIHITHIMFLDQAISVLLGFTFMYFTFRGKALKFLLYAVIFMAVTGVSTNAVVSVYLLLPFSDPANVTGIAGLTMSVVARLLIIWMLAFAVLFLIARRIDKEHEFKTKNALMLLSILIALNFLMDVLLDNVGYIPQTIGTVIMLAASVSILTVMAIILALYYQMVADSEERSFLQVQAETYQLTKEHTAMIIDTYEKISSLKHDLNNHFIAISAYLAEKQYDKLSEYVAKLPLRGTDGPVYSKNPVLNAVIGAKMKLAEAENIDFKVSTALPPALPVSDVELCILVGNVLDNAYEAKMPGTKYHYVNLEIKHVDSYCLISCENKSYTSAKFTSFGRIRSTKAKDGEHGAEHGIGTKQVQKIAESTGGYVRFKNEDFVFQTLVMLKMRGTDCPSPA